MAVIVGWTQTDVDTLRAAIASGLLSVSYGGPPARTVEYQSTQSMLTALAQAVAELAQADGTRQPFKRVSARKGV